MIETAIRRGWLEGSAPDLVERRARLIEALMTLLDDPATEATERERIQVCRMMIGAMTEANIRLSQGGELVRRTRRRRIRETARGRGVGHARRPRG
jgi:hypothetical protein